MENIKINWEKEAKKLPAIVGLANFGKMSEQEQLKQLLLWKKTIKRNWHLLLLIDKINFNIFGKTTKRLNKWFVWVGAFSEVKKEREQERLNPTMVAVGEIGAIKEQQLNWLVKQNNTTNYQIMTDCWDDSPINVVKELPNSWLVKVHCCFAAKDDIDGYLTLTIPKKWIVKQSD